jgi:hypothetical protein
VGITAVKGEVRHHRVRRAGRSNKCRLGFGGAFQDSRISRSNRGYGTVQRLRPIEEVGEQRELLLLEPAEVPVRVLLNQEIRPARVAVEV